MLLTLIIFILKIYLIKKEKKCINKSLEEKNINNKNNF